LSSEAASSRYEEYGVNGDASKLLSRTGVAKGTLAFRFEGPHNFQFRAGSIDLTLLGRGTAGLTHTFSIASDPSAEEIMVATHMRDTAFKRTLSHLSIGTGVQIAGPTGSLLFITIQPDQLFC
jgi:ferredoxin-NADP reductase